MHVDNNGTPRAWLAGVGGDEGVVFGGAVFIDNPSPKQAHDARGPWNAQKKIVMRSLPGSRRCEIVSLPVFVVRQHSIVDGKYLA